MYAPECGNIHLKSLCRKAFHSGREIRRG